MSGYPYGGNPPQYPPPQNQIYPQIYNPANAPPPGQPTVTRYPTGFSPQLGFAYPYPGQPQPGQQGQPNHPAAMSYPGVMPTAPMPSAPAPNYAYPGHVPAPTYAPAIEWIPTTPQNAHALSDRAVVAGYEGHDGSPLWVIRAKFGSDLIPGKLAIKHRSAYVPWGGKENPVSSIEVCCARPDQVRWVPTKDNAIPQNAVVGGHTSSGEPLYVGRAKEQGSLTPGKVHPSHKVMYISFAGQEIAHQVYEILCSA
ncbi:uncharacterized protein [Epargyreus clarus]|uniref:uncharacterized protein n=1 Tax=Epargyreus clarus TaxID=520877 RepID=UPI003C2F4A4A